MGDGFQGDVVHAGQGRRGAIGQPGKLAAIASGKVLLGGSYLLFDQVEIIQQPLGGGGGSLAGERRGGHGLATAGQYSGVLGQSLQQGVGGRMRAEAMLMRKFGAMVGHLLGTEQLGAQDGLVFECTRRSAP